MTITVTGDNLVQIRDSLGLRERPASIRIRWNATDYDRNPRDGCIVDATDIGGELVPRHFNKHAVALAYLRDLFKKRDAYVRLEKKRLREAEKRAKKHRAD